LSPSKKLVEVYIAKGEAEANIIRGLLDSFGIPSVIKTHASPSVHVFAVDDLGQVVIFVSEENAAEAQSLINKEQK
jgi:hypothetical protein